MYLVELDKDGLVLTEGRYDGVRAIKAFRDVLDDPELGRGCMTAIALTVDWLTPYSHYSEIDRPKRSMYEVTGDREAYVWNQEVIQVALTVYSELQYNPEIVEKRQLDSMQIAKLKEIELEKNSDKQTVLFKQLRDIKELRKAWDKDNEGRDVYGTGPVEGGYSLSRLEEKRLAKRSFYNNQTSKT